MRQILLSRVVRVAVCAVAVCAPALAKAQDARFAFRWEGAGGYTMTGVMAFDAGLVPGRIIRETDIRCFAIEGFRDGEAIGRWALTDLNEETTWRLFFDAGDERFFVEGEGVRMPQAWNMNGRGDNCGQGGFGFNLGNLGQDLCVDNRILTESRVPPPQVFASVERNDDLPMPADACFGPDMLSGDPLGSFSKDRFGKHVAQRAIAQNAVSPQVEDAVQRPEAKHGQEHAAAELRIPEENDSGRGG
ncbi:hypothetical protein [Cognatishimia sp. F0-27]|uniref:hypothetical protein n=1 Tax=Cognatishimia sp. F0-27 TaxID=2816855 RepID=UPI001D0C421A|nr:hypothetical protein [Cognatishimia sp. F0-27]MCC1492009.1 hypothetical protein [Cognatishimia sp. F0-27]